MSMPVAKMVKPLEKISKYPSVSDFVIMLFCGYVIIWYLQMGDRISFLGKIRFELIYVLILSSLALFTTDFSKLANPLIKYVALLLLCMVVQVIFSYDFYTSKNVFIDRVFKFSFMAFFLIIFIRNPRHLVFFLCAFFIACLKMGQEGLVGKITGGMVWENQGIMRLHGTTSLYNHPNSFAGMALGTLPFIYYLFPLAKRWMKICLLTMLGFAVNIIIFTASRTGYVAFIFLAFFVFMKSKRKKSFVACALLIGLIGIPFIPKDYVERFHSIFSGQEKEGHSSEARIVILKDAVKIFVDHPLGVGVAAFPAVRKATFNRSQDTHNLYLEVATNLGVQGLIVFMLFIYKMMKMLLRISRDSEEQISFIQEKITRTTQSREVVDIAEGHVSDLKLLHAVSSAVFMFLIVRLALGLFGMDLYEIYWWFSLGLTIALFNIMKYSVVRTDELAGLLENPS
jgi:putative inorganic carbon (hco3(-)) transporter